MANEHHPALTAYDRYGNRVDEITFHPSWHWLMERAVGPRSGGHALGVGDEHAHVRRAAGFFAWSQTEPGHGCPISMTYAAVPALRVARPTGARSGSRLLASTYLRPRATRGVVEARARWPGWG